MGSVKCERAERPYDYPVRGRRENRMLRCGEHYKTGNVPYEKESPIPLATERMCSAA